MSNSNAARILIVDDDPGLVRLIQKALKREGFNTAAASSGRDAIKCLNEHAVDLMLLDLKLPDIEGKDLILSLAEINKSIPFIIITGQGDERTAVDMMRRGALDYLVKDVQFMEFVPIVAKRALEQVEKDNRLARAERQALQLQKEILEVVENEQRRIGYDLHDGLGQQLTALELLSQALVGKLKAAAPTLVEPAQNIARQIRETITQTRLISHNLSPVSLDADGLMLALENLAMAAQSRSGPVCEFICPHPVTVSDANIATHLFRIAQEAVNNALKHSRAKRIAITLTAGDREWTISIEDDGVGLGAKAGQKSDSTGRGLGIMNYRAQLIGALLEIESPRNPQGSGVKISCKLKQKP